MAPRAAPSVLASWTRTILDTLGSRDLNVNGLLQSVGLSRALLGEPGARIPARAMARLWQQAVQLAGDPALGLSVSKFVQPTTFHALGYSVLASSSLRDALERSARYTQVVSDAARLRLERGPPGKTRLLLELPKGPEQAPVEAADAALSLLVRTCRWLAGDRFLLVQAELSRPEPADISPYERFFRCPVSFGVHNALTFDDAILDQPLPGGNPALARHTDAAIRDYLAQIEQGSLVDRVRGVIATELQSDVSPAKVAKQLGLSLRTMQRGLRDLGTSYEDLLRDTRRELAVSYLREGRHAVGEIAFLLGYNSLGAFTQAFKRWTGVVPSEFDKKTPPDC